MARSCLLGIPLCRLTLSTIILGQNIWIGVRVILVDRVKGRLKVSLVNAMLGSANESHILKEIEHEGCNSKFTPMLKALTVGDWFCDSPSM
jgi:hypothetical protein